jgi:TonB family protein
MQPFDLRRPFQAHPPHPPNPTVPPAIVDTSLELAPAPRGSFVSAPLRLAAPALLIEARFRDITITSRLLRADEPHTFAIGNARRADAPVNPAWLPEGTDPLAPRRHLLLEPAPGGFILNLTTAMRPRLHTELQVLPLAPDLGRAEAALALPPGSLLRIPCGEVSFDIHPAGPVAALPRPWLPARSGEGAKYLFGVALVMGLLMLAAHLIPSDPRALSLDTIEASHRMVATVVVPLEVTAPEIDHARDLHATAGGGGSPAAPRPAGQAGDSKSHDGGHMTIKGTARPQDARVVRAQIVKNSVLAFLSGPPAGALASVFDAGPAMGSEAENVLGNLVASNAGPGYGVGGLGPLGTGAGGGGEHEGMIGAGGPLGTIGKFGRGPGSDPGYGTGVGPLHTHLAIVPDPMIGNVTVRGTLDKEIIRRVVRRNLNQVKYCYQQALAKRPSLEGRVVTQFTIAPTGRVLAAVVQSSTLQATAVEACIVNAIKRWEFPEPDHGGLAMVSYPFSFAPAGE